LLIAWGRGEPAALEQLTPRVYNELRKLARSYLRRGRPSQSLQPTALINEVYLRLLDQPQPVQWKDRARFFGVAARLMRLILVDHARANQAAKRGGAAAAVTLDDCMAVSPDRAPDVLEVDQALTRLAAIDERMAKVIELRYFGGMDREEVAEAVPPFASR
jgi:RNA polymerase sigma factor (TIGR02999 family)